MQKPLPFRNILKKILKPFLRLIPRAVLSEPYLAFYPLTAIIFKQLIKRPRTAPLEWFDLIGALR